jgi:hypothetical protein
MPRHPLDEDLAAAIRGRSRQTALQRANDVRLDEMPGGGMSRVAKHMNRPFAMISAFRQVPGQTKKDNLEATKSMVQDLIGMGIGAIRMKGNYGSPEISFFVPAPKAASLAEFTSLMMDLGHKYEQDSVGIGDGEDFALHYTDGTVEVIGQVATMHADDVGEFFSEIKNKRFSIIPKGTRTTGSGKEVPNHLDHTRLKDDQPSI